MLLSKKDHLILRLLSWVCLLFASCLIYCSLAKAAITAKIIASPDSGRVPLPVSFTGSATGGVSPYSYKWDFGDWTFSEEKAPTHLFTNPGSFTVRLNVRNSRGEGSTALTTINVFTPRNLFNVKDYGAAGDGITDDTQAIQKAVEAAEAKGGGVILFSAGKYLVTNTVYIKGDYVTLRGAAGSRLEFNNDQPGEFVMFRFPDHPDKVRYFYLKNMHIVNLRNPQETKIGLIYSFFQRLYGERAEDPETPKIKLAHGAYGYSTFQANTLENFNSITFELGIKANMSWNYYLGNNILEWGGQDRDVMMYTQGGLLLKDNYVKTTRRLTSHIIYSSAQKPETRIINNYFDGAGKYGMSFYGSAGKNVSISGKYVIGNVFKNIPNRAAILFGSEPPSRDSVVARNIIKDCGRGVFISYSDGGILVTDNKFSGIPTAAVSLKIPWGKEVKGVTITNNIFGKGTRKGVDMPDDLEDIVISGNVTDPDLVIEAPDPGLRETKSPDLPGKLEVIDEGSK